MTGWLADWLQYWLLDWLRDGLIELIKRAMQHKYKFNLSHMGHKIESNNELKWQQQQQQLQLRIHDDSNSISFNE